MNIKELKVWQKSMDLADLVYDLASKFPAEERFGLASQMRRSAISVPSNIAEGHGRDSDAEFLRFMIIARGSLVELETQLIFAHRRKFVTDNELENSEQKIAELYKMMFSLIGKLKSGS